jgi:hypothetical protein
MRDAYGQALQYARTMDAPPPFLITTDIGYAFELYAAFDGSHDYRPFPNAQSHRIFLTDLAQHLDLFRAIWLDPHSLDPARISARVTRTVAERLAELAKSLESAGHAPDMVATFLMRAIFTMFAEDVGLLPPRLFTDAVEKHWLPLPASFPGGIESLWRAMNDGTHFGFIGKLLRFNGGLFSQPQSLPLTRAQLELLLDAAKCSWADVEPAIFGTLLERALNAKERHKLGAHYTPRAYVERLVKPTVEEPLRAEWDLVRAEVRQLVGADDESAAATKGKKKGDATKRVEAARKLVRAFHQKLCETTVLDPACGSGNFLYVTLDLFKRLESEVLSLLADLGEKQTLLDVHGVTVTPAQFHGIEVKRWAKEIADLVLWIGFLQWHFRTRGNVAPAEPVLRDFKNIECRDAVLTWDGEPEIVRDEATGTPVTRWDGESYKKHPVTGEDVPDESKRVVVYRYKNPRKAEWPKVDFVVGNPPFIGNKRMRLALGDGYVEALRKAHSDVPETTDYVMYWWHHSAELLRKGELRLFGLITTNSITQTFNRKVVQQHLEAKDGLSLVFAVPDHPWVENADGAAVRIAMTVAESGSSLGSLTTVTREAAAADGAAEVGISTFTGRVHADLTIGAAVLSCQPLRANRPLCLQGCKLVGEGFQVTPSDRQALLRANPDALVYLPRYVSGSDVTKLPEERYVIDFYGCTDVQARERFPAGYQILLTKVKPERDQNRRDTRRKNWWLFGENAPKLRRALKGLRRFIATSEVAKHRVFLFCDLPGTLADGSIAAIAHDDAYVLGVLSSRLHVSFALAAGGTLEDRPRYQNGPCFDPFPFPDCTESQKARIRDLGEQLDAHRKRQQAQHPGLTITGMYNVLEKLRAEEVLNDKERAIHEQGLVGVLRQLHDELDAAVFAAYDWPVDLSDEQILERLVLLNARRSEEERGGLIRWLRPDYQNPGGRAASQLSTAGDEGDEDEEAQAAPASATPWPKKLAEQIAAVRDLLARGSGEWTAAQAAAAFKGAAPDAVAEVLDSLAALGLVVAYDTDEGRHWRGAGRAST